MPDETPTTLTDQLRWMLKRVYKGKKPSVPSTIMGVRGYRQEVRRLKK